MTVHRRFWIHFLRFHPGKEKEWKSSGGVNTGHLEEKQKTVSNLERICGSRELFFSLPSQHERRAKVCSHFGLNSQLKPVMFFFLGIVSSHWGLVVYGLLAKLFRLFASTVSLTGYTLDEHGLFTSQGLQVHEVLVDFWVANGHPEGWNSLGVSNSI